MLVAHPDDEAVGCGALLLRMRAPLVVFATDGAPFDPYFWRRYGSREAYGAVRERELAAALRGIPSTFLASGNGRRFTDQELFRNLPAAHGALAPNGAEVALQPTPQELERKRAMCNAYASQGEIVAHFDLQIERFRPQPAYDFTNPPHPGELNYEAWQWRVTGSEVATAFTHFLEEAAPVQRRQA